MQVQSNASMAQAAKARHKQPKRSSPKQSEAFKEKIQQKLEDSKNETKNAQKSGKGQGAKLGLSGQDMADLKSKMAKAQ